MTHSDHQYKQTEWTKIFILLGAGIVAAFQIGKVPPIIPELMSELQFDLFTAGWIISSFNILGLLISPIVGSIADRVNIKKMMISGLCLLGFGSFLGSFANGPELLIITRLLEGAGYIFLIVSVPSLLFRITAPKDIRLVFGIWGSFMPIGGAIMMMLAPILTQISGWSGLWLINSIISFFYLIPLLHMVQKMDIHIDNSSISFRNIMSDILLVLKARTPLLLALSFAMYAMIFLAVLGFLPTVLVYELKISSLSAALLSGISLLMNAPGNWIGGILLRRGFHRWQLLSTTFLTMGLLSFIIYESSIPMMVRLPIIMLFFGIGGIIPATVLEGAAATAPERRLVGTSNGLLMQGAQIGLLIGPPALAFAVSAFGGWFIAPYLISSIACLGITIALIIKTTSTTTINNES